MTQSDSKGATQRATTEAAQVVLMLPWYVAGTLDRRDRERVEAVLQQFPELVNQVGKVREELAETIQLNESLGVPPPQVAERLMAMINAEAPETASARRFSFAAAGDWLTGFFVGLSPRTLAAGASVAVLAIALQAGMLIDLVTRGENPVPSGNVPQSENAAVTRGIGGEEYGTFAMMRFARQASAADITTFLQNRHATVVDGPTIAGLYRVRVATTQLGKGELTGLLDEIRHDPVIDFVAPSQ